MKEGKLYEGIQNLITEWDSGDTRNPAELTEKIMELIEVRHLQSDPLDTEYMYKWIRKHSGR